MPPVAGAARMPYLRFLPFDALTGAVWGTGSVLLGYALGEAWQRFAQLVGGVVLAVLVLAVVVGLVVRRRQGRGSGPGKES